MNREKLYLSKDEALDAINGSLDGFELIQKEIVGKSRWCDEYEIVIKRLSDGKFFKDEYRKGSTEQQDESPYEYSKPDFTEVFPKETVIIEYV